VLRPLLLTPACLIAALLTACSASDATRDAAIPAAKCTSALRQDLGVTDGDNGLRTVGVEVTGGRSEGPKVTGDYEHRGAVGSFLCSVAPDEADRLRGLRVTRLEVEQGSRQVPLPVPQLVALPQRHDGRPGPDRL
jgi:hypothetical protein